MKHRVASKIYKGESCILCMSLALLAVVFVAYVYFVSTSIADVVIRKDVDSRIVKLGASISELEAEYIEMQHLVSNGVATHNGYSEIKTKVFIDKSVNDTLVLNNN